MKIKWDSSMMCQAGRKGTGYIVDPFLRLTRPANVRDLVPSCRWILLLCSSLRVIFCSCGWSVQGNISHTRNRYLSQSCMLEMAEHHASHAILKVYYGKRQLEIHLNSGKGKKKHLSVPWSQLSKHNDIFYSIAPKHHLERKLIQRQLCV